MKTTCLILGSLGVAAGFKVTANTYTSGDCSGAAAASVAYNSGACTTAAGGSIKWVGANCTVAKQDIWSAAGCSGAATTSSSVTFDQCAGGVLKYTCTNAGAMASPGAWSMVVAAASMIAVMKQ
jgi:hypothetical protein